MSVFSERVANALFAKANVSGVLASGTGLATAVYQDAAPTTAVLPYVVFNLQASQPLVYTFGPTQAVESDIWNFQAFADTKNGTRSPAQVAEKIIQDVISTLGFSLTLTGGGTVTWMAPVNKLPNMRQQQGDRYVYQRGFLLGVCVE
jgi:hypothetical protein